MTPAQRSIEFDQRSFAVTGPLFCPYHNADVRGQGSIDYHQHAAFTHNPFTLPALGCSGSPVVIDRSGKFFGFLSTDGFADSTFSYDGFHELQVTVPEGQELFVDESGDAERAWRRYNAEVMRRLEMKPIVDAPDFWSDLEYCTWVEQGYTARDRATKTAPVHTHDVLTHDFVVQFLDQIEEYGYPKGKFTLDHGWGIGNKGSGFGSWSPDVAKFPNFADTAKLIADRGFTPGLWIGFPKIHPQSQAAKDFPELMGSPSYLQVEESQAPDMYYLSDAPALESYCRATLEPYVAMGFRKFKIDMSYNYKHEMIRIHRVLYRVAKEIDPSLEMEFHVPDIFAMQYGDVIRTNDIWATPFMPWRELTHDRYEVCYHSSPGRILNRDHVGGNHHAYVTEAIFLEHLDTYRRGVGYPVISLLPHHYGQRCVEETGRYLWEYANGPKAAISPCFEV